jgi:hypothetical protein
LRKDNSISDHQQTPLPHSLLPTTISEPTFITNVSMVLEYCNDEEENFRFFTLEELEGWATLLKEYQHKRYKHLAPYFQQAQEILGIVQTLLSSHTST